MGLAWQQGPLASRAVGRFMLPDPLPERLLYAEPLRRRMRVKFGGDWIADSADAVLLHEPGRYPVAYFPVNDIAAGVLEASDHTTTHRDLGMTSWYAVRVREQAKPRAAWRHTELPDYASELNGRVAFAWRAMDAFYEEDERILGHAADMYHRVDIRQTSRHLKVISGERVIADSTCPLALYESGFAPRWCVRRDDVGLAALTPAQGQTVEPRRTVMTCASVIAAAGDQWSTAPTGRNGYEAAHQRDSGLTGGNMPINHVNVVLVHGRESERNLLPEQCRPAEHSAEENEGKSDAELLSKHVAGDRDAFGELFRRHRDRLWAVALRALGDPEEAADALQDAMIAAFRRADNFRGDSAVTTWLHTIVVNAALDRIRRRAARPTTACQNAEALDALAVGGRPVADPSSSSDIAIDVRAALQQLVPEQQAALVLVDMLGYPVATAAQVLGVAEGTVKSRAARGRARLQPRLKHLRPRAVPKQGRRRQSAARRVDCWRLQCCVTTGLSASQAGAALRSRHYLGPGAARDQNTSTSKSPVDGSASP